MSRRVLRLAALAGLAAVLGACRLTVTTDVAVAAAGGGTFQVTFHLDRELRRVLADAAADPLQDLEAAAAAAPGWTVTRTDDDAGGAQLSLAHSFDRPEELGRLAAELHAGLGEGDAAILRDVTLQVAPDGAASFGVDAGVELPDSAGAEGAGVAFTGADLAALVRDVPDVLRHDLRLRLPGPLLDHDADEVVDGVLVWHLPAGRLTPISARSAPPPAYLVPLPVAAAVAGATLLLATAMVTVRRRRARRVAAEIPAPQR